MKHRILIMLITLLTVACGDDADRVVQEPPAESPSEILAPPSFTYVAGNQKINLPQARGGDSLCVINRLTGQNASSSEQWIGGHPRFGANFGLALLGYDPWQNPPRPSFPPELMAERYTNPSGAFGTVSSAAKCYPWSNFENLGVNPAWQLNNAFGREGLTVIQELQSQLVTVDKELNAGDSFCYLANVSGMSHTSEEAFLWQKFGPQYMHGFRWVLRVIGKGYTAATAHCVYLGRNYWWMGIQGATPGNPGYLEFTPEEAVCMPTGVWGKLDNGDVRVTLHADGVYRGNVSGELRYGQFACLSYYDPNGVTAQVKRADLEARSAVFHAAIEE